MKRVGNNNWPLLFDALLDGGRTSEKWREEYRSMPIQFIFTEAGIQMFEMKIKV